MPDTSRENSTAGFTQIGPDGKVIDPVCGMRVDPHAATHKTVHQGRSYFFCSAACEAKFAAQPSRYISPIEQPAVETDTSIYTCPMHPEIRQPGPGFCPICGMALEPVVASLEPQENAELADMRRRLWIGLALAVPVVALEMGAHFTGLGHFIGAQASNYIQFLLATPVVLWAGWPFFERGWRSLVTRNLNMFTLIAMGTGVAWIYSVVGTFAPQVFPPAFRLPGGAVAIYFEAAAVITVLVLLGQVLELRAREQRAAQSARFSTSRPARPGGCVPMAAMRKSASTPCGSATGC